MRYILIAAMFLMAACSGSQQTEQVEETEPVSDIDQRLSKYVSVKLTTDMSQLSENEKEVIPILIDVGIIMDDLFWMVAYGDGKSLVEGLTDEKEKEFAVINYGPWDRLDANSAFIDGVGDKPPGANYYPADISKEEYDASELPDKGSLYTVLRRDEDGNLITVPYSEAFKIELEKASSLLKKAAEITEDAEFKNYLEKVSESLLKDDYYESDLAWMDMKNNTIDIITGPIETYEDQLFGAKAAFTTYVLVKDKEWSKKLEKYTTMLPELQEQLPVAEDYKQDKPGRDSQLNVYDVIFYGGDCNAGSKTIAVNLPNDERVQIEKGTRRSQLKNAMKAKFDKILVPISGVLIDEEQRSNITFDAFFANTMFHEVAHGLGVKNTLSGEGTVREALKEHASAIEEGKADILGLYMVTKLHEMGEIEGDLEDYYVTFMASIFRSVRFGASSAHGKANMIRFNYFKDRDVFVKNEETGTYRVNFENLEEAMNSLSAKILTVQGDGDYDEAFSMVENLAKIDAELQADLNRLSEEGIPVDIVFEQGVDVLGLND